MKKSIPDSDAVRPKESASGVEQFCRANGQILLPIVSLIESASQVVEKVDA